MTALALTGYGKDLLKDILGADCAVVETIAHATAGLHFFPDADCICDVGGVDVKIMLLKQGTVTDFRLNSQCSSGNGAFLQGVADRFAIPLGDVAERAFAAQAMPQLSMGCGVFLQSDIVNQQRKGWQADEILAALCGILPLNVWIYAGGLTNMGQVGRKFILQGGTHRNQAVVKAQVDFIRARIPEADIVVHPYSGEAGAIGAALVARDWWRGGRKEPVPLLRRRREARVRRHHLSRHGLPLVSGVVPAHVHRRGPARRRRSALEQGAHRRGLGARDRQQLLPQGPPRGRERGQGGEGRDGADQERLPQRCGRCSQGSVPRKSRVAAPLSEARPRIAVGTCGWASRAC